MNGHCTSHPWPSLGTSLSGHEGMWAGETRCSHLLLLKKLKMCICGGGGGILQFLRVSNLFRFWQIAMQSRRNTSGDQTRPWPCNGLCSERQQGDGIPCPRPSRSQGSTFPLRGPHRHGTSDGIPQDKPSPPVPTLPRARVSGSAESQGRGHTRGQPGTRCRTASRHHHRCPCRRSAAFPSLAVGSVGTAQPTSCPCFRCLCSWTVHRAQSVCKGKSNVRATSGQAAWASSLLGAGRCGVGEGVGDGGHRMGETRGAAMSQDLVSTPSPRFEPWKASGVNPSPLLPRLPASCSPLSPRQCAGAAGLERWEVPVEDGGWPVCTSQQPALSGQEPAMPGVRVCIFSLFKT